MVIPLDELTHCIDAHRNPPDRAVVIAIDDGWRTVMRAYEVLKRRNLPFTLFKGLLDVALCFLIYKPLSPLLHK